MFKYQGYIDSLAVTKDGIKEIIERLEVCKILNDMNLDDINMPEFVYGLGSHHYVLIYVSPYHRMVDFYLCKNDVKTCIKRTSSKKFEDIWSELDTYGYIVIFEFREYHYGIDLEQEYFTLDYYYGTLEFLNEKLPYLNIQFIG